MGLWMGLSFASVTELLYWVYVALTFRTMPIVQSL